MYFMSNAADIITRPICFLDDSNIFTTPANLSVLFHLRRRKTRVIIIYKIKAIVMS